MRLTILILILICLYQYLLIRDPNWNLDRGAYDTLLSTAYLDNYYTEDFDRTGCEDAGDWTCVEIN